MENNKKTVCEKPLSPWRVKRSRVLVEDRWIKLRADDCVDVRNQDIAPYYVLEYPDWVQIVAIDEDERLVVVRQYRHGAGQITRELPSGCIDPQDVDAAAAGARELLEETGYAASTMRLVGETLVNPANHTNRIYILLAEGARRVGPQKLDPTEDIAVELIALADVVDLARRGEFHHAAQIASLFLALEARGKSQSPLPAKSSK